MPIYTYRCENCGVRFERYQKFEDQTLTWCPECNKKTLRKVFQPVGIVFKGSGFYSTDHRSPSGQHWGNQNSDKANETKTETKSDSKSDSKSDAKPAENPTPSPKTENKSE
jgi:putative FmdB family regulatory protein